MVDVSSVASAVSGLQNSGIKKELAVVGLKSQLQSQAVVASVVGDALTNAREIGSSGPGRGQNVNISV